MHQNEKVGARALVLSPTRELALQTLKFTKDLGKHTDIRFACILGGDSMEKQFEDLHSNPDVLIATPGRLLHIIVEMELKLSTVKYSPHFSRTLPSFTYTQIRERCCYLFNSEISLTLS